MRRGFCRSRCWRKRRTRPECSFAAGSEPAPGSISVLAIDSEAEPRFGTLTNATNTVWCACQWIDLQVLESHRARRSYRSKPARIAAPLVSVEPMDDSTLLILQSAGRSR